MRRARPALKVVLGAALLALLVPAANAASAQAAEPWWGLNTSTRPAIVPTGGEGTIVIRASNLGNAPTSAPATLSATLPAGVSVVGSPSFFAFPFHKGTSNLGKTAGVCKKTANSASCSTAKLEEAATIPVGLNPYEYIELDLKVTDVGAAPGAEYQAEASGGAAITLTRSRPLSIGETLPAFGPEQYVLTPEAEGGAIEPRAGSHPYQLTATFNLNQKREFIAQTPNGPTTVTEAPALARNLAFNLPPGQIGNAAALPACSAVDFAFATEGGAENLCPQNTVIGVATVTLYEPSNLGVITFPVPLFNLAPAFGEPARFGFTLLNTPVILDTSLRSGPGQDYGVTVSTVNTSQLVNFVSSTVTFWGTPSDPSHDSARGWTCLMGGIWTKTGGRNLPCEPQKQEKPAAFLTLPTDCAAPFATSVEGSSWLSPTTPEQTFAPFPYSLADGAGNLQPLTACNQVPFNPQIHSEPTSDAATSPTGLSFDIDFEDEGLANPKGLAQSQLKKALVTLPQGFTTNPSVAEGLKACSEAEYEAATLAANSGCTPESKVGEVTVQSPLVQPNQIVKGGIYVAKQHANPNGDLLTLYVIVREPEIGVLIRQALKVEPDPVTGQLTTEVDNVPELPFSHFHLFFRPGQRAPLVTPPACGTYTVAADLYPWSNPSTPAHRTSSFQITSGPEGQGCPSGGLPPFHPNLEAGTQNNAAGTFSPFYTHITRKDSEQEITHFSIKLPPGVIGKLAGIPFCSDQGIAQAKAREHEGGGTEELNSPSCPAASEIGRTLVGTGVGGTLAYAPGKLYLAGPYHGAPISIAAITAAKVGPFDLGTVVVREALKVNPETAEVFVDATGSDPIPHIVDGIPVHLRDIRIHVDRPEFVLNPTSCEPTSTASTVLGSGLNFATEADDVPVTITSRFQAADCAALPFKPKLKLRLLGATKRGGHPKLRAELRMRSGEANIAYSQVTLPHAAFLDQSHINTVCTRVQFKAGAGNGAECPAGSIYGYARAITPILDQPLEGPVYLRSSEHKLPDLVAALHNGEINIDLVGRIDSVGGRIRNTFEAVPDAPVSKFVLTMQGAKKGLIVNSTDLCAGTQRAIVDFTAHNGKVSNTTPAVGAKCPKPHKKGKPHHKRHGKRAAPRHRRGAR